MVVVSIKTSVMQINFFFRGEVGTGAGAGGDVGEYGASVGNAECTVSLPIVSAVYAAVSVFHMGSSVVIVFGKHELIQISEEL